MLLYIMRHGLALSQFEFSGRDADRPLSDSGQEDLKNVLPALEKGGVKPDVICTSPYLRTRQTTDILASGLGSPRVVVDENLASGARTDQMLSAVQRHERNPSLLLIGHMPDVGSLCSRFTAQASFLEDGLQPAEIVAIEFDGDPGWGKGTLLWRRKIKDWERGS